MHHYLSPIYVLLTLVFFTNGATAQDWTIVKKDGQFFAEISGFRGGKVALKSFGEMEPRADATSDVPPKSHPHIRLFSYFAGQTGSKRIVDHYRTLIVDWRAGKFLGDSPSSYIVSTTPRARQPQWAWEADHLLVRDSEFNRELRISLR